MVNQNPKPLSAKKAAAPSKLLTALANFPQMPDEAFVAQPVVESLYSCSAATVWRMVKAKSIPQPHKTGPNSTRWKVGELRAALAAAT
jgi:predicted DNA-binding transcriptional regulator AlpA